MDRNKMGERIYFLDGMRAVACLMVIMVHSCEFFFIDGTAIGIRSLNDGWWVSVIDSAFRCSVPLFVMISSYLLVPVKGSVSLFFRKRMVRVMVPFVLWSVLYATLPYVWGGMDGQEVFSSLWHLFFNFNGASGHLWFVYMLVGLYLFMPVLSPWLERAGEKGERSFLILWFVSTFFPYLRAYAGELYGECYWNEYHALWYYSGFVGYVVLAHYIRHYLKWTVSRQVVAGVFLYVVGFIVTATVWYTRIPVALELQELEISWRFCTPNVVMMSLGAFLLIRAYFSARQAANGMITEISRLSYGIYLMHIFILNAVYQLLEGCFSTPVTIVSVGLLTFIVCILLTKLLSCLPKSRYLIG